ncbi:MAG TPA: hypothetical protein DCF62_10260 [Porticoccaceae bacterium]|nr:hypothetical protein [Porticoccaceae bacterium]HCO59231.1 hypothetical protein [Porticoccaceae bacterium]
MTYSFPRSLLIQFAKTPELGKVKTRMQPCLSQQQSLSLHCRMLEDTYRRLSTARLAPMELWVSGDDESNYFRRFNPLPVLRQQMGSDLGERMHGAFADSLKRYESVVLVGSDCPFLSGAIVGQALAFLAEGYDCVVGPATDGGYVLIALKQALPDVFQGISWGGPRVLEQTRSRLRNCDLNWFELAALPDIDSPQDLTWITPLKQYDELFLSS